MKDDKRTVSANLVRINSRVRKDQKDYIRNAVKNGKAESEGEFHRSMLDYFMINHKK